MFALLLRYFAGVKIGLAEVQIGQNRSIFLIFSVIAVASMFTGNLLALQQKNVKRLLAYSSISHLGYLLVAFLAGGKAGAAAVSFYLAAYFVTTLGAFGVVTVLSHRHRDADTMEEYRGLFWRRPWLGAILTGMMLSLAGIPLTAGFVAKFSVMAAGVGSALYALVILLAINSAIGLYYYLRVVVAIYSSPKEVPATSVHAPGPSYSAAHLVLTVLMILLFWLGVYPSPLLRVIDRASSISQLKYSNGTASEPQPIRSASSPVADTR
jgi:NADH-quinone oxidoreductase subunit N